MCLRHARHDGHMGRGKATECHLIQAWKSTDYNGRKYNEHTPPTPSTWDSFSDRVQILHRGRRDTKVKEPHSFNPRVRSLISPRSRFGWFWQCPNGDACQYRHALPPGFVLKSQKKAMEEAEKANQISLEEFLEVEVRPLFQPARVILPPHMPSHISPIPPPGFRT